MQLLPFLCNLQAIPLNYPPPLHLHDTNMHNDGIVTTDGWCGQGHMAGRRACGGIHLPASDSAAANSLHRSVLVVDITDR